jgi:hypothetical protein
MYKKLLILVILLMGLACVAYMVVASRRSDALHATKQVTLPSGYDSIKMGMSESQVAALVGQPLAKSRYAKYEQKPPAYWAALQKQASTADTGADQGAYGGAPSMTIIRAKTELTHQYRDVWQYQPVPTMLMTLYFNDQGVLLNEGTAVGGSGKGPGGPGSRSSIPRSGG